jgi:type II secretory pathway component PulJ
MRMMEPQPHRKRRQETEKFRDRKIFLSQNFSVYLSARRGRNRRQNALVPNTDRGRVAGFTLIEVVIGSALTALILVSAYACLSASFASQKLIEPRVEILQNARVAMALMSADLRAACPLSKDYDFLGMPRKLGEAEADNLDFATHNYTPRHPREGDFCQTSFFLDKDAETGQLSLWRRRNPMIAPDPLSGGSREEIARGLLGLRFEYFDGIDWYDSWGEVKGRGKDQASLRERNNLSGLPEAVRITLLFDSNPRRKPVETREPEAIEPPLVFQTVARLNLAGATQRNSSGDSTDATGQGTSGNPGQGGNQ